MRKGGLISSVFAITDQELKSAKYDIVSHRKDTVGKQMGQFIIEELDVFIEELSDEKQPHIKKWRAEVAIIEKNSYGQMIINIQAKLEEMGLTEDQLKIITSELTKPLKDED